MTIRLALDLDLLRRQRCVAIIRGSSTSHFATTATTLASEGISILEFPLTTAGVLDVLPTVSDELGPDVHVGVGSVITERQAIDAHRAGAAFLVTPAFDATVIAYAKSVNLPVIAGAFSPTEVVAAWRAGATAVKLFPASVGGPDYLRELVRGPFPDIPLVPTGGVEFDDIAEYLDAGAVAFGMGSSLIGDAAHGGDQDELRRRVGLFRTAVARRTRPEHPT